METTGMQDIVRAVRIRSPFSHKGENGTVLVIGGSEHYVSAPALSALAAIRTGIDLIQVAAPEKAAYAINSFSIDFITKKYKGREFHPRHVKELAAFAKTFDVVLIGPGLGKSVKIKKFVNDFMRAYTGKIVVDADALQQLEHKNIRGLLTPHRKEFETLFGKLPHDGNVEKLAAIVKAAAKKCKCTILLKGRTDIISDGKSVKVNPLGNAGMTIGGTGDVLAGMCAGFMAQGAEAQDAASAAVLVMCTIGDHLLEKFGYGFVSSDFIPLIPQAIFGRTEIKEKIAKAEKR